MWSPGEALEAELRALAQCLEEFGNLRHASRGLPSIAEVFSEFKGSVDDLPAPEAEHLVNAPERVVGAREVDEFERKLLNSASPGDVHE
jgi:hypothetical protein